MTDDRLSWLYTGIWGVLVQWFQVPKDPPLLPSDRDEMVETFQAARGYLRYKKLGYWIGFAFFLFLSMVGIVFLTVAIPVAGLLLAGPALILFAALAVVNYVAIHLEYDTTWYVVGANSVRTRTGVWTNREITVNYENVQNVSIMQGPLQRWFGISDVRVETAGSEGSGNQSGAASGASLQGIDNAETVKRIIQARCDASPSAGLGDEHTDVRMGGAEWPPERVGVLRDIRDAAVRLANQPER